jgi:DNA-binding NtrC family response regulator
MTAVADEHPDRQSDELRTILLIDAEVAVRAPLARYLRDCGLTVVEVGTIAEAKTVLLASGIDVDLALCDTVTSGTEAAFTFSQWMKSRFPGIPVLLAGSLERTAALAGDLCDEGPSLSKPYDLSSVLDDMKRALAAKRDDLPQ